MFRTIDRIIFPWLALFLCMGALWLAVTIIAWIQRYWVWLVSGMALLLLLCLAVVFVQAFPTMLKVRRIRKEIERTPRLPRYAWSSDRAELIRQWEVYETEGKTPVRRSTMVRRLREANASRLPEGPRRAKGVRDSFR